MVKKYTIKIALYLTFIVTLLIITLPAYSQNELIIPGVTCGDHDIGNKNKKDLYDLLELEQIKLNSLGVNLFLPGYNEVISATHQQLGIKIDQEKIWQEAVMLGREGNWWQNFWKKWYIRSKGYDIPLYLQIDKTEALKFIQGLSGEWKIKPSDARFVITPNNKVKIIPEKYGQDIDKNKFLLALEHGLEISHGKTALDLVLSLQKIKPRFLQSELETYHITGLVSSYTTYFNSQKVLRSQNIKVAAKYFGRQIVAPQEIFSFNKVVGPRTKERGFCEANIILNKEYVLGVGGGVCQVSSTLYNALLLAGVEIVERHNHSLLVSYVEPGRDAAVVYPSKDLKFKNNFGSHLLITCTVGRNALTYNIYGHEELKRKVILKSIKEKEIAPETVYQEDPQLASGTYDLEREGSPGYIYVVECQTYNQAGKLVKKEIISRDTYPPVARIIKTSTPSALLSN